MRRSYTMGAYMSEMYTVCSMVCAFLAVFYDADACVFVCISLLCLFDEFVHGCVCVPGTFLLDPFNICFGSTFFLLLKLLDEMSSLKFCVEIV